MLPCIPMERDPINSLYSHFFWLVCLLLVGCHRQPENTQKIDAVQLPGCRGCHSVTLDPSHDLGCPTCHSGKDDLTEKNQSHKGLISQPAHPDHMAKTCGACHKKSVEHAVSSSHFTLHNKTNTIRRAFGAHNTLASSTEIPVTENHDTPLTLADDLLRRRCLRCHLYSSGDDYPATIRGTGCAACHLHYENGSMQSHSFLRTPGDDQCLHCHYGNRVGADYVGRYEQDIQWEYRTPFVFSDHPRPSGVEYHPLSMDIHAQAGMGCVDCHNGMELKAEQKNERPSAKISCLTCHDINTAQQAARENIEVHNGQIYVTGTFNGKKMVSPLLTHVAHKKYSGKADCFVCHAQWVFSDQATHFLRLDNEDVDSWSFLSVQGSSSVETAIDTNNPVMPDGITGELKQGAWIKSFLQRRWAVPLIGKGEDGRLHLYRPLLDISLSYVDEEGETIVDNIKPVDSSPFLPYSPHTIGPAGMYYENRLKPNLSTYLQTIKN